jgi:hypothetical protein
MLHEIPHEIERPAANHVAAAVSFAMTGPYTTCAVRLQSRERAIVFIALRLF